MAASRTTVPRSDRAAGQGRTKGKREDKNVRQAIGKKMRRCGESIQRAINILLAGQIYCMMQVTANLLTDIMEKDNVYEIQLDSL